MLEMIIGTEGKADYAVLLRREHEDRTYLLAIKPMTFCTVVGVALGLRVRTTPEIYKGGLSESEAKMAQQQQAIAQSIHTAFPLPYDKLDGVRGSLTRGGVLPLSPTAPTERFTKATEVFIKSFLLAIKESLTLDTIENEEEIRTWLTNMWLGEIETACKMLSAQQEGKILSFPSKEKH